MRKKDMRIERTQNAIKKAFLFLLEKMNYGRITIQDIADEAIINRNTFYLHYKDKDVLIKTIVDEHIDILSEKLNFKGKNTTKQEEIETLEKIASTLLEDIYFLRIMFECSENKYFLENFEKVVSKNILENHAFHFENLSEEYKDIQLAFIISGMVGLIKRISQGTTLSPNEIAQMIYSLFFRPAKPEEPKKLNVYE